MFSLEEKVRGLGCQMGDLKGTVDALQDQVLELQKTTMSDSSENFSASCRIPKDVSLSTHTCIPDISNYPTFKGKTKSFSFKPK